MQQTYCAIENRVFFGAIGSRAYGNRAYSGLHFQQLKLTLYLSCYATAMDAYIYLHSILADSKGCSSIQH